MPKPIVLTILDGWGYRPETHGNAIAQARKPTYDALLRDYPNTLLRAYELAAKKGRALHLIGLLSDGGVHSHQRHLDALIRMAARHKLTHVFVHAFMDGRDTLPTSGLAYLKQLQQTLRESGTGQIASVSGRYFAMDRDLRWEKERQAFDALVTGHPEGGLYSDPIERIKELYNNGITDEFVPPFTCINPEGNPIGLIKDHDVVINFNYRADRVRQITRVLTRRSGLTADPIGSQGHQLPKAAELDAAIPLSEIPANLHYVCMTQYDKKFNLPIVIPPESMDNLLANLMSQANLRNLRVAETEKYAHVTYFFNGGIEKPFPGEDRVLVPSQKVATYDLKPEMSAAGIADVVVKAANDSAFDVIIVNFANADMVGHSGKIEPTVKGVETVDACLGQIEKAVRAKGGAMLITADHGNAEMMIDPTTGGPHTAHTTNPVPFIVIAENANQFTLKPNGSLRDISPTILGMLNLAEPKEMTGHDLRVPLVKK